MRKDLVVLVADIQQEKTIEALLTYRQASLNIRTVSFDIYRHPLHHLLFSNNWHAKLD